ncbi:MAG: hypothetical protein EP343_02290 [Deltaproteobacteria bacterium]|nr:MAG: hypothetical protein EP343_02290 [Deltaproteobacteria bacterium]
MNIHIEWDDSSWAMITKDVRCTGWVCAPGRTPLRGVRLEDRVNNFLRRLLTRPGSRQVLSLKEVRVGRGVRDSTSSSAARPSSATDSIRDIQACRSRRSATSFQQVA